MRKQLFCILLLGLMLCPFHPPALAEDAFTPSRKTACDHENCYWTTPMDIADEDAVWAMLMAPVTVISGNQKEQYPLRDAPGGAVIGDITCDSQSVHVLSGDENGWTKVETYSSSFHDSSVKAWNALVTGYVETARLEEKTPAAKMGMVVDKLTQRLYLFADGKLYTTLRVSTGMPNDRQPYNETRSGEFFLVSKVGDFRSDNMYCEMGLRFNDGDLLHQVPYFQFSSGKNYDICEKVLGERASHGCIRVQRKRTPEGVNMTWIWNNYQKYTKLIIWEDWAGREKPAVPENTLVYYNPKNGKNYHLKETCYGVNSQYLPMTAIPFEQLYEDAFAKLTPCVWCNPPEK